MQHTSLQNHKSNNGGLNRPSLPQLFDERIILAGLFLVALFGVGNNIYYAAAYALVIVTIIALAFAAGDKLITAFGIYLSCWYIYSFTSAAIGLIPKKVSILSFEAMVLTLAGFALYLIVKFGKTEKEKYYDAICCLAIILSLIVLIQLAKGGDPVATLGCTNFLAAFLAIATFFFCRGFELRTRRIWKIKLPCSPVGWWIFLPLILFALYTTKTSTAVMALAVGLGYYLWKLRGAIIAVIPGLLYATLIDNHSLIQNERYNYWLDAFNQVSAHWQTLIFGVGPGNLWRPDNMLHSEPFYVLFNLGVVGLLIVAAYVARTFYFITDRRLIAVFIIIIIDSLGNHVFHTAPTAMLAIVVIALMDRENLRRIAP